jgi:hypothetical protein
MMLRARTQVGVPSARLFLARAMKCTSLTPSAPDSILTKVPTWRVAPLWAARWRSHSSNSSRLTMPTKPLSMGMSTCLREGATMRAHWALATSKLVGDFESL